MSVVDFAFVTRQLDSIAGYRDWQRVECAAAAEERGTWRWRAESATERVVALFSDFGAADAQRRRGRSMQPGRAAIIESVRTADRETHEQSGGRRLIVLLLVAAGEPYRQWRVDARQALGDLEAQLGAERVRLECWHVGELAINPVEHRGAPAHRLATAAERASVATEPLLPVLRADDAMVRWLGYEPGALVHVAHESSSTGLKPYLCRVAAATDRLVSDATEEGRELVERITPATATSSADSKTRATASAATE